MIALTALPTWWCRAQEKPRGVPEGMQGALWEWVPCAVSKEKGLGSRESAQLSRGLKYQRRRRNCREGKGARAGQKGFPGLRGLDEG